MNKRLFDLLNRVPKNQVSQWMGRAMDLELPGPLSVLSIRAFADLYGINTDEAEKPIHQYKSIGEFFARRLKPGVRPIEGDLVHPCDAVITEAGFAADGILMQAKGMTYSLESLLQDHDLAEKLHGGLYATYYLCPTDYHRVHAPADGQVSRAIQVPGALWPVNAWSVRTVRQLFAINERIITVFETRLGTMAIVMVGATNVGKMAVSYDSSLVTNRKSSHVVQKMYQDPLPLAAGDELGTFHMGSTVILVCEPDRINVDPHKLVGPVKMGQRIIP